MGDFYQTIIPKCQKYNVFGFLKTIIKVKITNPLS